MACSLVADSEVDISFWFSKWHPGKTGISSLFRLRRCTLSEISWNWLCALRPNSYHHRKHLLVIDQFIFMRPRYQSNTPWLHDLHMFNTQHVTESASFLQSLWLVLLVSGSFLFAFFLIIYIFLSLVGLKMSLFHYFLWSCLKWYKPKVVLHTNQKSIYFLVFTMF